MSQQPLANSQNLIAHEIPLVGKHLIEASAGTGKTYNITRLYLRMLLERQLPVEKILVMTFTKDATQELKGRIDSAIRDALNHWDELSTTDEFFQALAERVSEQEVKFLLKKALLFLDEAAIFTIHGFCQRVLIKYAFGTNMSFDANLATDLSDITEQACQDWYRTLASNSPEQYLLLADFWPNPASFLSAFAKAIYQTCTLDVLAVENIEQGFVHLCELARESLTNNEALIYRVLIDSQKAAKRAERIDELTSLQNWLQAVAQTPSKPYEAMPTTFFNGTRYSRSPEKAGLLQTFEPLKKLKTAFESLNKNINKAKAYEIVRIGIYAIRENIQQQKQQKRVLGFDDLVANLASSVVNNQSLAKNLNDEFTVALVDEFQDTDPDQFTILNAIYHDDIAQKNNSAVYMIGDPKQAIYGFRGGDVFAYLAARELCQYQWVMDTNWRSSNEMITAYNRLFYGANLQQKAQDVFGYNIPYLPVKASVNAKPELTINTQYKALQFVHFNHPEGAEKSKVPQSYRTTMATWCAQEIQSLLTQSTHNNCDINNKKLSAKDIAILVRDGGEAKEISLALFKLGLTSVYLSNRSDLFQSAESQQLLLLLKGILHCENERLFSAAVTSPLLNYQANAFYQLKQDELAWQTLRFTFEEFRKHWLNKGFMSMALTLMHEHFVIDHDDQDRVFTNLLHLFELLQIASQQYHQPHELLFWFEQHVNGQVSLSETELRLESDDDLIKIVTQHGSKGLEYPVVFLPFVSRYKHPLKLGNKNINLIEYHDEDKKLHLSLDGSEQAKAAMIAENHAETIRLLYVAITRAEQRCYLLTTDFEHAYQSPLGATLKLNYGDSLLPCLKQLADGSLGIGVTTVDYDYHENLVQTPDNELVNIKAAKGAEFAIPTPATFTSKIERDWWLSSFSALTRHVSHGGISRPDRDIDHQDLLTGNDSHLIRFTLPKGAQTGNFLHAVFEICDFTQPNWSETLQKSLKKYHYLFEGFTELELIDWLNDILTTPLMAGVSLSTLSTAQTLREAEFYFPMENANMSGLVKLLSDHRIANQANNEVLDNDIITDQINTINLPLYRQLKGMMHGFIDLIFEVNGKYYVCDYKSTHLGEQFDDYQFEHLQENVEKNYYDLQYLIYSLALHRYLTVQLPDYQIEQHFGGVYYLYLRGMKPLVTSDQASISRGVYFNCLSAETLQALDALFSDSNADSTTTQPDNTAGKSL